tara:strand:- start:109 stop:243 length:135 start_codon:yes stop_codon:yes gene_type:complete
MERRPTHSFIDFSKNWVYIWKMDILKCPILKSMGKLLKNDKNNN